MSQSAKPLTWYWESAYVKLASFKAWHPSWELGRQVLPLPVSAILNEKAMSFSFTVQTYTRF